MTTLAQVHQETIEWAAERSGKSASELEEKFPDYKNWGIDDCYPKFSTLEKFAKATFTPIGVLFLSQPPTYKVPIADYRSRKNRLVDSPSLALEETLNDYLSVQAWYREYALTNGLQPDPLIGGRDPFVPIEDIALEIRDLLDFDVSIRKSFSDIEDVYRHLVDQLDQAGVLVGKSGIVRTSTNRSLNPDEFGGFALYDDLAPLIFVNGKDHEMAHIFTLVHELTHLVVGRSGISDSQIGKRLIDKNHHQKLEQWCNRVAAEVLVPKDDLRRNFADDYDLQVTTHHLALRYRVSNLVVAYSLRDANLISQDRLLDLVQSLNAAWERKAKSKNDKKRGGSFYRNQISRLGKRFTRALISETLGGATMYSEAARFIGSTKESSLQGIAGELQPK